MERKNKIILLVVVLLMSVFTVFAAVTPSSNLNGFNQFSISNYLGISGVTGTFNNLSFSNAPVECPTGSYMTFFNGSNSECVVLENISNIQIFAGGALKKDKPDLTLSTNGADYFIYNKTNNLIYSNTDVETTLKHLFNIISDGDKVYLSKGTYETNNCSYSAVFIQTTADNIEIYGDGESTIIWNNCRFSNPNDDPVLRFDTANNLYLHDFSMRGNQSDDETLNQQNKSGESIHVITSSNIRIENMNFLDGLTAITIKNSDNVLISNLDIKNNEHAFGLSNVSNINIDNINYYKYARDGSNGFVQSAMKAGSKTKNLNINNFYIEGVLREGFRFDGVNNVNVNNLIINSEANYPTSNLTHAGFTLINVDGLTINNMQMIKGEDMLDIIPVSSNNNSVSNIIMSNSIAYNHTLGIKFEGDGLISDVTISDSKFLLAAATGSTYGIFFSNNNLSNIKFTGLTIKPMDSSFTGSKAFYSSVSINNIMIDDSYLNGVAGDMEMATSKVFTGSIMNSHFKDNDIRGSSNFAGSSYVFRKFYGNTYGAIYNPSDYGDFMTRDNNAIAKRQIVAYDQATDRITYYDGSIWDFVLSQYKVTIGSATTPTNITMYSPDGTEWNCGVNNTGGFNCN